MPDCPVARRRCNCGPNGSARDSATAKASTIPASPETTDSRLASSPVGRAVQIRVTKPPAAVRQTVVGSRAAPSRMARCGAPLATCRRPPISAASATRLPLPAHGDRHHGIAAQQGTDPAQRSLRLVALAQQHALREMAVLDPGPQLVEQSPDTRPAGETVGRMAQMVQGKARLVQRPLGDQRREDGRRHPQDGAAPGRQGAVQMLEPVQRQIGRASRRARGCAGIPAGRAGAWPNAARRSDRPAQPAPPPRARSRSGPQAAAALPPPAAHWRSPTRPNAARAHPRRARPTAAASPARAGRHPRATAGGRAATTARLRPALRRPCPMPPSVPSTCRLPSRAHGPDR